MENNNNFRNVVKYTEKEKCDFKKTFVVPFVSSILGCTLVIGTCFGVPSIKQKLIGYNNTISTSTSTSTSSSSSSNSGTVDMVSLNNYSDTSIYAANKILPSIVGIEVTYTVKSNMSSYYYSLFGNTPYGQDSTSTATASGSGIVISEDGYILTNNHVVASSSESTYYEISDATSIKIKFVGDDTQYDATIVGKDSQTDLAVLKIDKSGLTAAEFADSDSVKVGEFTMAVGNPLNLGTTITCGVVSAVNREVSDEEGNSFTCIQTDAAINSGNSGGALVNSKGQVIGINTMKVASTGVEGIGFAIPINSTTEITNELITYNKVRRPYIGISGRNITEDIATKYNLVVGVYIVSIENYSAAEKAGLQTGDVITKVDNTSITTMDELNEIKNKHSIGDQITLTINRNGQEKQIVLTLGESNAE